MYFRSQANAARQCSKAAEKFDQVSSFMAVAKWMGKIHLSYLNSSIWLAHYLLWFHAVVNWGSLAVLSCSAACKMLPILGRKKCGPVPSRPCCSDLESKEILTFLVIPIYLAG